MMRLENQKKVPPKLREQLAICGSYPDDVLFLDIETTGLSHYYDEITVVGWSLGGTASTFVKGEDHSKLLRDAASAKAMVTFNGIRFDRRFLLQEFPEIKLPDVHIDLMYLCRRVGLTGGQKSIENQLGLSFRDKIEDVDGFAAVLLWHRYLRGEIGALEKLIQYNRADIAAMGAIFDETQSLLLIEPDFFYEPVTFRNWSAPKGWQNLPSNLKSAKEFLTKAPHFGDLFQNSPAYNARVVGIDLTGAETKASGWCFLQGNKVNTRMIFHDSDLVEATIASKPDIVSIDSPLCLPKGRIAVGDDDPGREQYGIMRECERELKRRGVNVYPCLLPSMQKLTARGIKLAKIFREKGIPVIESYPGAAQDIMRIPRKGAGIEWLKTGLKEFGIIGEYTDKNVTHDELDAITSALVGTFHLAGMTEAMGTEEEDPLIVPDMNNIRDTIVVGISGPIAAGKTTFAKLLEKNGFTYTRFSLAIDDRIRALGLEPNRETRQKIGLKINQEGGQRLLAEETIKRAFDAKFIVVDGMRFPEDHAFMIEKFGARFRHFYIDANRDIRRARFLQRAEAGEFCSTENSPVELKVDEMRSLAHEIIENDLDLRDIEMCVNEFVAHINGAPLCQFLS